MEVGKEMWLCNGVKYFHQMVVEDSKEGISWGVGAWLGNELNAAVASGAEASKHLYGITLRHVCGDGKKNFSGPAACFSSSLRACRVGGF
jgi:hypothetical protein